jgi:hypothetical protein
MGGKSGGGSSQPSTTTQYVREAPEIEAFKLGLLEAGKELAQRPITLPIQQIAGQSPYQMAAYDRMAQMMGGLGAYAPIPSGPLGAPIGGGPSFRPTGNIPFDSTSSTTSADMMGGGPRPDRQPFNQLRNSFLGGMRTGPETPFTAQTVGQEGATGGMMPAMATYSTAAEGIDPIQGGIDPIRGGIAPAPERAPEPESTGPLYAYPQISKYAPGFTDPFGRPRNTRFVVGPDTGLGKVITNAYGGSPDSTFDGEPIVPPESLGGGLSAAPGAQPIDVPDIQPGISAYQQLIRQGAQTAQQGAGAALGALGGAQPYQAAAREALMSSMANIPGQVMPAQQRMAQAAQFGQGATAAGIGSLTGAAEQFSPEAIQSFMSPYEDAAVQSALGDIARQGQIQREQLRGQAAQAGAFGGSRQAVAESELGRNILDKQGQVAAEMRRLGYQDAAQRAAQAFEQARGRQIQTAGQMGNLGVAGGQLGVSAAQQAGQLGLAGQQLAGALGTDLGQLGAQYGQLGLAGAGQLGQLGLQQGSLGESLQTTGIRDIAQLTEAGKQLQAQQQAELEAQRTSDLAQLYEPYQRLGFLSDIYKGAPSTQMTTTQTPQASVSPAQQYLGLGIAGLSAAAGAQKAGLF